MVGDNGSLAVASQPIDWVGQTPRAPRPKGPPSVCGKKNFIHIITQTKEVVSNEMNIQNRPSIRAVKNHYTDILKVLTRICLKSNDVKERTDASSLKCNMDKFEFIVFIIIWERLLLAINSASSALQAVNTDLSLQGYSPWHWEKQLTCAIHRKA
jgi:hypothetical protein